MKKFFCVVLPCTYFFSYAAMNPRDTDDKIPGCSIKQSSSDLRVDTLRKKADSSPRRPIVRSKRLNTDDDRNNVVPNLNAAPKKID